MQGSWRHLLIGDVNGWDACASMPTTVAQRFEVDPQGGCSKAHALTCLGCCTPQRGKEGCGGSLLLKNTLTQCWDGTGKLGGRASGRLGKAIVLRWAPHVVMMEARRMQDSIRSVLNAAIFFALDRLSSSYRGLAP